MATEITEFLSESPREPDDSGWLTPWRNPVRLVELVCLLLLVALCDVTIFSGGGFSGYAVLFTAAPVMLYFGVARRTTDVSARILAPMLLILAARLTWCGDWLGVATGFALLAALAMALTGLRPYVLELIVFAAQTIPAGFLAFCQYAAAGSRVQGPSQKRNWLAVAIPGAAFFVFSLLFLLANPDLLSWVNDGLSRAFETARVWLAEFAPTPLRVLFWIAVAWISAGLLRPLLGMTRALLDDVDTPVPPAPESAPAPLYEAFRNMLVVVTGLFGVYLVYEFTSVWSREFPPGSYSAYAHEGAFWLTVALAVSTVILSGVFQGRVLADPRLRMLRRWSRVWAVENFLLAVTVYHRMFIYVEFNGMTRMRIVGLLGITAVVAGFVLVLVKIAKSRSFLWLIRRDLWALGFFVYLYVVLPVDLVVMRYNVRRIMEGDPAPSVQISVHPSTQKVS